MDPQPESALDLLVNLPHIKAVYHVDTYHVMRESEHRGPHLVEVKIVDNGPADGDARYKVVATDYVGRKASGSPAATIREALDLVHWGDLDK